MEKAFKMKNFLEEKTLNLENLLDDDEILRKENFTRIFFLETHMNPLKVLDNPRHACSVESAAKINPDAKIYLILTTNTSHASLLHSELAGALLSYENIQIRFLNPYEFSEGTIIEEMIKNDTILNGKYPIEHMADVMRVLILSKYGGQYLDLDVLSLVPLSMINKVNFACPEANNVITNAVLNVDAVKGKKVMNAYLKRLNSSYNPESWGGNGPVMLSQSIKEFCVGTELERDKYTLCDDFSILPSSKCYPVTYGEYSLFYKENGFYKISEKIYKTRAYFVHIWNKMQDFENNHYKLTFNSDAAYIKLGRDLCPKSLGTLEKYFK